MKVSEVAFKDLKIGDSCISAIGNKGTITGLFPESREENYRYDTVSFEWENGKKSVVFHMDSDKIEYI